MIYPQGWRVIHGDKGTATVVHYSAKGRIQGYLNLTPRQGNEELATWPPFRLDHNHDEGDRHEHRLAAATGLAFRAGHGSCIKDSYKTSSGAPYIEIACLVTGSRTTSVVVGASPPRLWEEVSPVLQRAIAALRT